MSDNHECQQQMPLDNELVSIVIPAWNAEGYVGKCLESCVDQTYRQCEVILVDNGSVDGTSQVAQTFAAHLTLRIIRLETNQGFAGGANAGIAVANGKYVLVLNSDVELHPDFLAIGLKGFRGKARVAAVGGTIFNLTETARLSTVQSSGNYLMPYASLRGYPKKVVSDGSRIFAPASPACIVLREALEDVRLESGDYFDSNFWCYAEDIDLWLRIMLRGWICAHVADCTCWHRGSMSFGGAYRLWDKSPSLLRIVVRNKYYVFVGTLPWQVAVLDLPWYLFMDILAAVVCAVHNPRSFPSFMLAKWDALRKLPYLWRKRKEVLGRSTIGGWAMFLGLMRERFRAVGA